MFSLLKKNYDFNGKSVWVTGASSGLGLALAKLLSKAGARVSVSARREKLLYEHFSRDQNVTIVAADLSDRNENIKSVEKIIALHGGLDCIILNAGTAQYIDCRYFQASPFENMIKHNFLSMVYAIEASLPYLRHSASAYIVGMSSSVAWQGLPTGEAYSASKAAIANMLQGLRIELAADNIRVTTIYPGFVKTPLTDKNTFAMPFRINVEDAALRIMRGINAQKATISFPRRFTLLLRLIAALPDNLSSKILSITVPQR